MAAKKKAAASANGNGRSMLTREESMKLLDERTQKYLGMSAKEFVRAAKAKKLPDNAAVTHLQLIAGVR